jgi:V8-like Glu-specific endopeptidase
MKQILRNRGADSLEEVWVKERIIGNNNLLEIPFLAQGVKMARTVCRIVKPGGAKNIPQGTGFMVGPGLLMTNNHVIERARMAREFCAEFDYEGPVDQAEQKATLFEFDPDRFFVTSTGLDYSIIALKPSSSNKSEVFLDTYGYNELTLTKDSLFKGQTISIVQHPEGLPKMIAFRDSKLIELKENQVYYTTDTQRGSSGSPVTNDAWEVVALHRSGVPATNENNEILLKKGKVYAGKQDEPFIDWIANQGVLVDSILAHLYQVKVKPEQESLKKLLLKRYLPSEGEKYELPLF